MTHGSGFWHWLWLGFLLGLASWYLLETGRQPGVSRVRQACFYAGTVLAAAVIVGPVAELAFEYFWAHMIQHISLMMLISPLLILGSPGQLLLNSRFGWLQAMARGLARFVPFRWLFKPQVGWVLFLTVLIGTHFSPLANAGMVSQPAHAFELVLFLMAGCIYYYAVLEGNPKPYFVPHSVRLISLFAMMLPETMTGFFLYASNGLLHTSHQMAGLNIDALTDQHIGGALMWSMGMIIDSVWIVLAAIDFFADEKRKSAAYE